MRSSGVLEPADARADHDEGNGAERQEQQGLKRVHPRRAAHPAEKHVAITTSATTRPRTSRDRAAADGAKSGSAADHADDDVRNQQRRLHREDERADVPAFPAVAEELHRGNEAVPLAERPYARTEEEKATSAPPTPKRTPSGRTSRYRYGTRVPTNRESRTRSCAHRTGTP